MLIIIIIIYTDETFLQCTLSDHTNSHAYYYTNGCL